MKILLFGKSGQVGWELNRSLLPMGEVIALGRKEADLSKPEGLRRIIRTIQPDVIINAAAYTNVEKAESEQDLAYQINAVAPGVLAEECQRVNALMVHYSTDYVFDGKATKPYREDSGPNPLNIYGRTKNDGEIAVRNKCSGHLIIRSSWVFASRGSNFVKTIIELVKNKNVVHVIDDQIGAPTWARNIADASVCMIRDFTSDGKANTGNMFGTYHLSSAGGCSWYEFSKSILAWIEKNGFSDSVEILPISSDEYNSAARRPGYTVLDNEKVSQTFAIRLADWEYALGLCLADMQI